MKTQVYLKFIFILFFICIILFSISCKPIVKELSKETTITETVTRTTPGKTAETKNNPPEIKEPTILPDNPNTSQDLNLTYEFNDLDKDPDKSTIKWYKNDKHISNFDNVLIIPKLYLDPDDNWHATVTPYDGKNYGTEVTSNKTTILKGELKPEIIYKIDISLEKNNQEDGGITNYFIQDEFLYITYNIYSKIDNKWIISKGGLKILDISDLNNVKVLSNIDNIKGAGDIFINKNYAYILVNDQSEELTRIENEIIIIDIKDKKNPKIISSLINPGKASDFFVEENFIYVTAPESGLQIIDIKDKELPKLLSIEKSINIPLMLLIKENYAYIWGQSDNFGGLYVIDVSDKKTPYLLNKENFNFFGGLDLFKIENTNLYIINYEASRICSLKVFSLDNKEKPILKNEFKIPIVSAVDLGDNFLYTTNFDSGLPLEEGIMFGGSKKYEAKHDTALKIIDISSNEKAKELAKIGIADDQGIVWPDFIEIKNNKVFIMYPVMDDYMRTLKNYISIVKLYN